jgi:hypothetical protein
MRVHENPFGVGPDQVVDTMARDFGESAEDKVHVVEGEDRPAYNKLCCRVVVPFPDAFGSVVGRPQWGHALLDVEVLFGIIKKQKTRTAQEMVRASLAINIGNDPWRSCRRSSMVLWVSRKAAISTSSRVVKTRSSSRVSAVRSSGRRCWFRERLAWKRTLSSVTWRLVRRREGRKFEGACDAVVGDGEQRYSVECALVIPEARKDDPVRFVGHDTSAIFEDGIAFDAVGDLDGVSMCGHCTISENVVVGVTGIATPLDDVPKLMELEVRG